MDITDLDRALGLYLLSMTALPTWAVCPVSAVGLGTMISGLALDLIEFPVGAAPSEVDAETVFNLGAVYGPLFGVFMVFAVYCITHYRPTKEIHAEIKAELVSRRGKTGQGETA